MKSRYGYSDEEQAAIERIVLQKYAELVRRPAAPASDPKEKAPEKVEPGPETAPAKAK